MAWRAIQDTVGQSESLAELSDLAERIYWRLLAHSDPWGRLDARPRKLRARCYPMLGHSDEQAGYALIELEAVERILVYEAGGEYVVQIVDFETNQPREAFRKRSGKSRFPDSATDRGKSASQESRTAALFGLGEKTPLFPGSSGTLPEERRNAAGTAPEEVRPRREGEEKDLEQDLNLAGMQAVVQGPAREVDETGLPARNDQNEDLEPSLEELPLAETVQQQLARLQPTEATT